ncbi:MAG: hypothetical protein K2J70_06745 [Muribaculaceae bacterium]|nr:hypothetical protein [Muribaculaceae bacterium]
MEILNLTPGRLYTIDSLPLFRISGPEAPYRSLAVEIEGKEIYRIGAIHDCPVNIADIIRLAIIGARRPVVSVTVTARQQFPGEQPESVSVTFDVISYIPEDIDADGLKLTLLPPFFINTFSSYLIPDSEDPEVLIFSMRNFRLQVSAFYKGEWYNLKTIAFAAKSSEITHVFRVTLDSVELRQILIGKLIDIQDIPARDPLKRVSVRILPFDPLMDDDTIPLQSVSFYFTENSPSSRFSFFNKWMAAETFHSFGEWSNSRKISASKTTVDSMIRAFDRKIESEIVLKSHGISTIDAEKLSGIADMLPDITVVRYLGTQNVSVEAVISEISVETADSDSAKVEIKAIPKSDKVPAPDFPGIHSSEFTGHFT